MLTMGHLPRIKGQGALFIKHPTQLFNLLLLPMALDPGITFKHPLVICLQRFVLFECFSGWLIFSHLDEMCHQATPESIMCNLCWLVVGFPSKLPRSTATWEGQNTSWAWLSISSLHRVAAGLQEFCFQYGSTSAEGRLVSILQPRDSEAKPHMQGWSPVFNLTASGAQ